MIRDASAMPGVINCPLYENLISSSGLFFMRWYGVLQDEGWAVLCLLTNKSHKLNPEIARPRVYIYLLPAYTTFLYSFCIILTDSIPIFTSRDLQKTTPLVPKHTQ
jgi:hypothetical protein